MKISIIIPTLNEEKILSEMLTSLRMLSSVAYEIIISDGGSTDKTISIAQKFADIVVVHDGSYRQTIGQGKNEGAMRATGELLLFLDADVFVPEINTFFTHAVSMFSDDEKLQGLTVFLKVLPDQVTFGDKVVWGMVNMLYVIQNNILGIGVASGEFQMIRANIFKKLGGYDKAMAVGEDLKMFRQLSKVGKTRIATKLYVLHTSRRAHAVGWVPLLWSWVSNMIYSKFFKKSLDDEWKVIR